MALLRIFYFAKEKIKATTVVILLVSIMVGIVSRFFWNDIAVFVGIREPLDRNAVVLEVAVEKVKKKDMDNIIEVMGTVSFKEKASISSKILGRIDQMLYGRILIIKRF